MKKLLTASFLTLGILLISGCYLNDEKVVNNSIMTEQILALQQQMDSLSSQIETLKQENDELKKESEKKKKENNTLKQGNIVEQKIVSNDTTVTNLIPEELENKKEEENTKNIELSYCNKEPGQQVTDTKYENLGSLGFLFTASDCGPSSLQRFSDVQNHRIDIWLNKKPSQSLIDTYLSIGFNCYEGDSNTICKSETGQKRLSLEKRTTTSEILKLKKYYEDFEKVEDFNNTLLK